MKVIQINVVADQGSTGKIVCDIDKSLRANWIESEIYYGRKSHRKSDARKIKFGYGWEMLLQRVLLKAGLALQYGGNCFSTRRLEHLISKSRPDVVHIQCANGYCVNIYRLLKSLAKKEIPTVITHHAEFYYTGNCGHALDCNRFTTGCGDCPRAKASTGAMFSDRSAEAWRKMKDAVQSFRKDKLIFTSVSPWVKNRSAMSPIVEGYPCEVVLNGVETSTFNLKEQRKDIRGRIPDCKDKMVLHVTASFSDRPGSFKGGDHIVELAKRMPHVTFVVASNYSDIEGELPKNVYLWGRTNGQEELAELYNAAGCTVIASKKETFSMVVAESLCCGTPVVGFKAGGPETITIPEYSEFAEQGDIDALQKALEDTLSRSFNSQEISSQAIAKYSKERMTESFIKIYEQMI